MNNLKFLNHASYLLESDKSILLFDPWFEKGAFNNGWQLYYQKIKNGEVIEFLKKSGKKIYIWISHEHSDHFNIPFIKSLKAFNLKPIFLFHQTVDKRVFNYLKNNNFIVNECSNGKIFYIDSYLKVITYRYSRLDSLCITNFYNLNILNLNDCVIKNQEQAKKTFSKFPAEYKNIDILFTQFGYAQWIGREIDKELRLKYAEEKLRRIFDQNKVFNPRFIIPFASFVYFSKQDNFYMNEEQNGIKEIRTAKVLSKIQNKIYFMKPNQILDLNENFEKELSKKSSNAEEFWNNQIQKIKDKKCKILIPESCDLKKIIKLGKEYIYRINNETLYISYLSEFFQKLNIKSLKIYIYDLKYYFSLSYVNGFTTEKDLSIKDCDLIVHSNEIHFILKNEFGWNTINVSGSLKVNTNNLDKITSFFLWQDAIKNGFSYKKPLHTILVISKYIFRKIFNK